MARPRSRPSTESDALILDDQNANRGTARGRRLLEDSLKTYGAGRSVLTDRTGRVIAGNKTVEQARALRMPIQVVESDGRRLIVVRRTDLDLNDTRARALAIADNRVAELDLAWDSGVLDQLRKGGLALDGWWTEDEWTALVGQPPGDEAAANAVLEPGTTSITRGDLFQLGRHRLLCGDATEAADVTRLLDGAVPVVMATDPPYGVEYNPAARHTAYPGQRTAVGRVLNDDCAAWPAAFQHFPGPVVYAWHAGKHSAAAAGALTSVGFDLRAQIMWFKSHYALSRSGYHYQHEPAFYAVRRKTTAPWYGDRTQSTVWSVPNLNAFGGSKGDRDNVRTAHSTQKPVRLFEIPFHNHTRSGEAVYDPFVGSGTAIIAAEKTGRVAYAMDLDPRYVQVAIDRWEAYTGQRAIPIPAARLSGRRRRS